jgi:hypothetical protein
MLKLGSSIQLFVIEINEDGPVSWTTLFCTILPVTLHVLTQGAGFPVLPELVDFILQPIFQRYQALRDKTLPVGKKRMKITCVSLNFAAPVEYLTETNSLPAMPSNSPCRFCRVTARRCSRLARSTKLFISRGELMAKVQPICCRKPNDFDAFRL